MLATAFNSDHTTEPVASSLGARASRSPLAEHIAGGQAHTLEAKSHLFCEGDAATYVYRIEVGHVCLYRMMPDGRRQVVDFAYPGDIIGLGALGEHPVSAQAMERTVVRSVPIVALREQARRDTQLGMCLYEAVASELNAVRELLFTVSQRTAMERVAAFLLALSRRSARRGEDGNVLVLPMTRADIGDFLGLTIETISRTLTRLRLDGVIDLEQCILVTIRKPDVLAKLAEGEQDRRGQA